MFSYTEIDVIPKNIFVFGCGGTGSRTIPPLLQLIKSQSNWLLNPSVYLIDGDEVEPKNCSRQHFIPMDVGKNKAQVLAERYSTAYEMQALYYPAFFEQNSTAGMWETGAKNRTNDTQHAKEEDWSKRFLDGRVSESDLFKMTSFLCGGEAEASQTCKYISTLIKTAHSLYQSSNTNGRSSTQPDEATWKAKSICFDPCVVILCVDSAQARRNILAAMTYLYPNRKVFVIDAGNEDIFGQVMFYRLDHRIPLYDLEVAHDIRDSTANAGISVRLAGRILSMAGLRDAEKEASLARALRGASHDMYARFLNDIPIGDINPSFKVGALMEGSSEGAVRLRDLMDTFHVTVRGDRLPDVSSTDMVIPILPCPDLFYDNLEDGEGTRSCADLDQTLSINNLMAAAIINIVNNLVYGIPFDFNAIRISLNGGYSVDKMSPYWLKQAVQGRDPNYSSYLARQTWETMIRPSRRTKEESELFLGNLVSNTFYYKNRKRNGYSDTETFHRIYRMVSSEILNSEISEVMDMLQPLLCMPGMSAPADTKREFITGGSKLSEEQLNLLIDIFMYATISAGILDLAFTDCTYASLPLHLTGVGMHGTLYGPGKVLSLGQTPTAAYSVDGPIGVMLSDYLIESYLKGEVSEEALLSYNKEVKTPPPPPAPMPPHVEVLDEEPPEMNIAV